ncbi:MULTISPECIES: response regulator transcription factor [unclassified Deinococcus]|uniref:response regulator transcription factor n=1 Tax=unclassified Deinococcus TaxID=2623546 RepID=UPI000994055C|nr:MULTISPECIES: response regulator transcription factor [unclassified Deinococcus]MBX8465333.1 response regulator transcription factor [Deinococcus sp. RIT780]MCD0157063.1 response regulator transcription factor [Deinococcus sp. 6GRE01]MCD0162159.1 response regulator transcription factor [Deinococcus sp. 6YEL10]MCD0171337.1 response regulator transcription factor [Deinococcus sp. 23YEL01]MCD0175855.1 response regulator transcription factor [Deinococcus sp. 14RED07]
MPTVLIVDDDPAILEILRTYLSAEGHTVLEARTGPDARDLLARADVAVIDWMLPGLSGVQLARDARRAGLTVPLLMLTGRGEEEDKLRGLDGGVDDYVVKPFSPREVTARVRALLRRAGVQTAFRVGELHVDLRAREVRLAGARVELSKLEFDLLTTMAQHAGMAWSRERLLERVWGSDFPGTERVVDVHITSLRRKLRDTLDTPRFIETVRGVGYRFREDGN